MITRLPLRPIDTLPVVKPTKLVFESNATTSAEESDRTLDDNKQVQNQSRTSAKNVSFVDDLNRVLMERRRNNNL